MAVRWLFGFIVILVFAGAVAFFQERDESQESADRGLNSDWNLDSVALQGEFSTARVLPANPSLVDLLQEILPRERIAAIPESSDRWSRLDFDNGSWRSLPRFAEYRAESVLGHRANLVLASQFNRPETTARLRERGVSVLRLKSRNGVEDVCETLLYLGELLGVSERAISAVSALRARATALAELSAARRDAAKSFTVLYYSNHGTGGWTFGEPSSQDEVFRLVGLRNLGSKSKKRGSHQISLEEVLVLDPDLLVVSGGGEGDAGPTRRYVENEPVLRKLRAVRENAIVEIPSRLLESTSQEVLTAAEWLDAHLRERGLASPGAFK